MKQAGRRALGARLLEETMKRSQNTCLIERKRVLALRTFASYRCGPGTGRRALLVGQKPSESGGRIVIVRLLNARGKYAV